MLATTGLVVLGLVAVAADVIPDSSNHLLDDVKSFEHIRLGVPTYPLSIMQDETKMFTFDAAAGSNASADAGGGIPMSVHCSISPTIASSRQEQGSRDPEHLNMQLYSAENSWFFRQSSVVPGVDKDLNLVVYPGYMTMVVELTGETDILAEQSGVILFCEASPLTRLSFNTPSDQFDFDGNMHRKMFLVDTSLVRQNLLNQNHDDQVDHTASSVLAITCAVTGNTGISSIMVYELYDDCSFAQIGSSFEKDNTELFSFGLSLAAKMMTVTVTNVPSERGFIANLHNELSCRTDFELVQPNSIVDVDDRSVSSVSSSTSFFSMIAAQYLFAAAIIALPVALGWTMP